MKISRIIALLVLFCTAFMISCDLDLFDGEDDDINLVAKFNDRIGPLEIEEIVYGNWKGTNHIQGICFDQNTLFISNTKQLITYSKDKEKVIAEQRCHELSGEECKAFHYGDPAFYKSDLWVPLSTSKKWKEDYYCHQNKLLKFEEGIIQGVHMPKIYLLDFPGHVGAVEILNDKVYVAGKDINTDWPHDDNCHEEQIIYVYNLENLVENTCNLHNDVLSFTAHGKNGIQNLAEFGSNSLLVTAYKCEDDPSDYVYLLDLETGVHTLYRPDNWAYGVAMNDNGMLYFCEDNRNTSAITINAIVP
ncbi:hypothetical protein [Maribacter arenosus]|uniref:TolB-like 6-blade propeller-like n=1 Tax=Maribacter arenosus TaxID=1854708 RepID=A0ABR7V7W8_9FLAO|nr:hypothetical protein [Maribacter arenosus]MBD0849381.1 hypothetical protein [Maribacter arenosus]